MNLRFPQSQIGPLAQQYEDRLGERDRRLTEAITRRVFPSYGAKGYLTKAEFITVCEWKSPRSKPRYSANDADLVKEISIIAKSTDSERLRIQLWTLLAGVKWPTASVFVHFAFPDQYPIMDFRALWSLREEVPNQYSFDFWWAYVTCCRKVAREAGVSMRVLDQALWQYSKVRQKV